MVLVIVTRNIDLSVGALVGVTGMTMGILQVDILPQYLGLGHPCIWIITVIFGHHRWGNNRRLPRLVDRLSRHPCVYRDTGRFACVARLGLSWPMAARRFRLWIAPFQLLGGGPYGAVGETGELGCWYYRLSLASFG